MMQGVAAMAGGCPCHVSLEERMACGVGVCMGCVTQLQLPGGGRAWQRICVEGPVFDARELVWALA
jgi:dihydroorotate dehydrogenase electron transfer subunit